MTVIDLKAWTFTIPEPFRVFFTLRASMIPPALDEALRRAYYVTLDVATL